MLNFELVMTGTEIALLISRLFSRTKKTDTFKDLSMQSGCRCPNETQLKLDSDPAELRKAKERLLFFHISRT